MNMNIKNFIFLLLLTAFSTVSIGQTEIARKQSSIDLNIGWGQDVFSHALSWHRTHGITANNKLRVGYGLRFSGLYGTDLKYSTAPAKLTKDEANIDTITLSNPTTMGLNAAIYLEYQFSPKFVVGFNIDAIGVGFGSTSETSVSQGNSIVDAKPTSFNVLLVGDNDIGQLKSELYLSYFLNPKWRLNAGLDLTFSEYTTSVKLRNDNDRFRNKANFIFIGASYNL